MSINLKAKYFSSAEIKEVDELVLTNLNFAYRELEILAFDCLKYVFGCAFETLTSWDFLRALAILRSIVFTRLHTCSQILFDIVSSCLI